eukprot:768731-Hanusia_phi.AAC.5
MPCVAATHAAVDAASATAVAVAGNDRMSENERSVSEETDLQMVLLLLMVREKKLRVDLGTVDDISVSANYYRTKDCMIAKSNDLLPEDLICGIPERFDIDWLSPIPGIPSRFPLMVW